MACLWFARKRIEGRLSNCSMNGEGIRPFCFEIEACDKNEEISFYIICLNKVLEPSLRPLLYESIDCCQLDWLYSGIKDLLHSFSLAMPDMKVLVVTLLGSFRSARRAAGYLT